MNQPELKPSACAIQARDLISELNRATLTAGPEWEYPAHAYSVAGALSDLANHLPQAIDQLINMVDQISQDGHLGMAGARDDKEQLQSLHASAVNALSGAMQLHKGLTGMHSALSPMTYKD